MVEKVCRYVHSFTRVWWTDGQTDGFAKAISRSACIACWRAIKRNWWMLKIKYPIDSPMVSRAERPALSGPRFWRDLPQVSRPRVGASVANAVPARMTEPRKISWTRLHCSRLLHTLTPSKMSWMELPPSQAAPHTRGSEGPVAPCSNLLIPSLPPPLYNTCVLIRNRKKRCRNRSTVTKNTAKIQHSFFWNTA